MTRLNLDNLTPLPLVELHVGRGDLATGAAGGGPPFRDALQEARHQTSQAASAPDSSESKPPEDTNAEARSSDRDDHPESGEDSKDDATRRSASTVVTETRTSENEKIVQVTATDGEVEDTLDVTTDDAIASPPAEYATEVATTPKTVPGGEQHQQSNAGDETGTANAAARESDGARQRPAAKPAHHEPAVASEKPASTASSVKRGADNAATNPNAANDKPLAQDTQSQEATPASRSSSPNRLDAETSAATKAAAQEGSSQRDGNHEPLTALAQRDDGLSADRDQRTSGTTTTKRRQPGQGESTSRVRPGDARAAWEGQPPSLYRSQVLVPQPGELVDPPAIIGAGHTAISNDGETAGAKAIAASEPITGGQAPAPATPEVGAGDALAKTSPVNSGGEAEPISARNAAPEDREPSASAMRLGPQRSADHARFVQRVARALHVATERGGELRLRLSPPELGSVRLHVTLKDGALSARLETETPAARAALVDNLPALRERLAEHGVRIERFDVDLFDDAQHDAPSWQEDRQATNQTARRSPTSAPSRPTPESDEQAPALAASTVIGSEHVNVVI